MAWQTVLEIGEGVQVGGMIVRLIAKDGRKVRVSIEAPASETIDILRTQAQERRDPRHAQERSDEGRSKWQTPSTTRAGNGS